MKKSNMFLAFLLASFFLAGLIEGVLTDSSRNISTLALAHALVITALLFGWVSAHSQENNNETIGAYGALVAVIPPIGVPIYFIRYFGFWNGLIKIAKAFIFLFVAGLIYSLPYLSLPYLLYINTN